MLQIFRAFAWMRWRVLVNSLERTGARDTLQRFSIAMEQISPIIAIVLLVPSALAAAALGAAAGYALAVDSQRPLLFEVARFILFAAAVLSIVGPIAMPAGERTNPLRLLLLPIPRALLYAAHTAGALGDPWILVTVPLLLLLPAGLAAGGAPGAAGVALVAGLLLLFVLVGMTSLVTSMLHLIVRNRRRGELIALLCILVLPMIGLVPALSEAGREEREEGAHRRQRERPLWVQIVRTAAPYVPTELYVSAVRRGTLKPSAATGAAVALVVTAVALHALALLVYRRLLDSPASGGASRRSASSGWSLRLPGISAATAAIALSQVRLVVRTPRGRSMLLSPLILVAMFGAIMYRGAGDMRLGFIVLESGAALATFAAAGALLSIVPMAMNQFAIDGAGLTLVLLTPASDGQILAGKALGNGFVVLGTTLVCTAGALVAFPGGPASLWVSVLLGLSATYVLATPVAALLSSVFPRSVNMNSIGGGSNAHALATLLGILAFIASAVPCVLLVLLAMRVFRQPAFAPMLLLVWLLVCGALATALFRPVREVFARRRENLVLTV